MIDYDNLPATIDRLHTEAEELGATAQVMDNPTAALALKRRAADKIKTAARLRAQMEG